MVTKEVDFLGGFGQVHGQRHLVLGGEHHGPSRTWGWPHVGGVQDSRPGCHCPIVLTCFSAALNAASMRSTRGAIISRKIVPPQGDAR